MGKIGFVVGLKALYRDVCGGLKALYGDEVHGGVERTVRRQGCFVVGLKAVFRDRVVSWWG